MGAPATDAADARVVLGAQVALGRLAAAPANLGVEVGAVAHLSRAAVPPRLAASVPGRGPGLRRTVISPTPLSRVGCLLM